MNSDPVWINTDANTSDVSKKQNILILACMYANKQNQHICKYRQNRQVLFASCHNI